MAGTALLVIDVQNDYFPGGAFALEGAGEAAARTGEALAFFRAKGLPVVHVRHESLRPGAGFFLPGTPGAEIHPLTAPAPGEAVVLKHFPNSFRDTGLEAMLRGLGTDHLVICGMMTNMCVDATARAGFDLGFSLTVLSDACAAAPLTFSGETIPARQVHGAFLAALGMVYAKVVTTGQFVSES